ncbi:MAG: DUF6485 family protein [Nitrososphaerota archaeon]|nr:DUF6485 family protein [Candidatus Geocrenenecus dongiae]
MPQRLCNIDMNLNNCSCTYEPCPRKGVCCECLRYHWSHRELPACFFPPEIEKTYDRSLKTFINYWSKKIR